MRFPIHTFPKVAGALGLLVLTACAPTGAGPGRADGGGGGGSCGPEVGVFQPGAGTLAFAGDVLLHRLIQADAAARPEGFAPAFAPVAPFLRRADATIVNLEGPAARAVLPGGRDAGAAPDTLFDDRVYGGYPTFNYHPSIAGVLARLGVDVVQTANNHALDRGPLGVDRTHEALRVADLSVTGTRARGAAGPWHTTLRVPMRGGSAQVAILACTFSVNGLPDPARQALRCYGGSPSIPERIAALQAAPGIDAVILTPHWGSEYAATPTARQRSLARAAIEAGAAAVVGAHPHVLQPMETLTASDGRRAVVAYSLGNFIAAQWSLAQRTGGLLYLDLRRDGSGRVVGDVARLLPTRVERYADNGVTVSPAHLMPSGGDSVSHAARILGAGQIVSPDDLACAR